MSITRFPGSQSEPIEQKSAYVFGEVIRKYRVRAKYNQRDLAERMGVNQNTICNWETDKRQPDAQTLRRLCLLPTEVGENRNAGATPKNCFSSRSFFVPV